MIGMKNFGMNGRLGNQMFQASYLYSLSEQRGLEIYTERESEFNQLFETPWKKTQNYACNRYIKEPGLDFDERMLLIPDNTEVSGFFQSDLYFPHARNRMRTIFKFNSMKLEESYRYIKDHDLDPMNSGCIHIRQGDYLNTDDFYNVPTLDYYIKTAEKTGSKKFLIFSDAVFNEKDSEALKVLDYKLVLSDLYTTFILMSMCESHVISASTFSWWSAYLSGSDKCFRPDPWYGKKGPGSSHLLSDFLVASPAESKIWI